MDFLKKGWEWIMRLLPQEGEPIPVWDGNQKLTVVKDEEGTPHLFANSTSRSDII